MNVTITVSEEVARWAKIWAAEHNSSVSKLVGELLTERMNEEVNYQASMKRYFSKESSNLRESTAPYPKRDDLYDR